MLNWLARYAPVVALLRTDPDPVSILDVGCGPHGLACAMDGEFAGIDVSFPHAVAPAMHAVRSRPGPLPFADGAFHTVVCLDVLEHIPGPDRDAFVAELARVAAARVILACPSSECQPLDDHMAAMLGAGGRPLPEWLSEHYDCVLPTPEAIAAACDVDGFAARELPMASGLLSAMTVLAEFTPTFGPQAAAESAELRDQWVDLYASATFGPSWRKGWVLERIEARTPLIDPADYDGGMRGALRCPDCGSAHEDLVCTGCGRTVTRDATGALDLATAAPPEHATSVVVVAYGQRDVTAAFLDRWAVVGPDAELVLVDNGSPDDTLALLQTWRDRATVIALPENRNFSGGCNAGAAAASGDVVVFLNNDTLVEPGLVEALAEEVRNNGAAVAGARLLYPDGTLQHAGVGMAESVGLAVPHHLFHGAPGELGAAQLTVDLDCVTGACLAIDRERFLALGGFDEAFVNGWEDVDLCLRVRASGGRVVYRGDLAMVHDEGRTRGHVRADLENQQVFYARWGALLAPDDELAAEVWDARFGVPDEVAAARATPAGRAEVAVAGDPYGIGPWADQTRAALAALEAAGLAPGVVPVAPIVLTPRLTVEEWAVVARASARVVAGDTPVRLAADVGVAAPQMTHRGGGGTLAVLPAHDLPRAEALLTAAGPDATFVPTAATAALRDLAAAHGATLQPPCSSPARLALLAAGHDVVLTDDPADPFGHHARIATAAGAAVNPLTVG